jgi:membrane dipeptidase
MSLRDRHSVLGRTHESRRLIGGTSSFQAPGPSQDVHPAPAADSRELFEAIGVTCACSSSRRREVKRAGGPGLNKVFHPRAATGRAGLAWAMEHWGLTDVHAHPAMNAWLWGRDLRRHYCGGSTFNPLASLTDFKMLSRGGVGVQWSSLHVPEHEFLSCLLLRVASHLFPSGRKLRRLSAWECLLDQLAEMERQVARADGVVVVRSVAELDAARARGDIAIVHTVEGGHVLGDDPLPRLRSLSARGVASLTLTHLFPRALAGHTHGMPKSPVMRCACPLDDRVDERVGLTALGREVVEEMVVLRMLPDVSHCTALARREVYALVADRIPVVMTHTGVRSLNDVPYNADAEDVRSIASSGGLVGVIFMPYWLSSSAPKTGRDVLARTFEQLHTWSGGTWDHVALGTDFDGFTDPPDDFAGSGTLGQVRPLLEEMGLAREDVEKVLGGNARRVLVDGWR